MVTDIACTMPVDMLSHVLVENNLDATTFGIRYDLVVRMGIIALITLITLFNNPI